MINWFKGLWGKVVAIAIGASAIFGLVDYLLKLGIYSYLLRVFRDQLLPFFLFQYSLPFYIILILAALSVFFIGGFVVRKFWSKNYYIPIKDAFYTGFQPTDFDRRTKWNFKMNKRFYYIPLLPHSYNSVEFRDLCGPYCSTCDHLLRIVGSEDALDHMGHTFFCVNCIRKYKVPIELLGNYSERIFSYFNEEFRRGNLREG